MGGVSERWCRCARRRWRWLALALALAAALSARLPAAHEARSHFPHAQPHKLAHLLADFSHQPNVGSWSVVEDASNYTSWRYAVTFACGPRCAGRARVAAHDEWGGGGPAHGARALRHRLTLALSACTHPPLLPWPLHCEETETEAVVWAGSAGEGGAWVDARARARCRLLDALSGACARRLRAHHDALVLRVRAALDLQHAR